MQRYFDTLADARGNVQAGLSVLVKIGGQNATIYSDNGTTAQANPMTSDSNGGISFYAANGTYDLSLVAASGSVTALRSQIILFDPLDCEDATPTSSDTVVGVQGGVVKRFYKDALGPFVNVKDPAYGATGDGTTDDTAAIQAAINTGKTIVFPESTGAYRSGPLTQATAGQRFVALGNVTISKNANGVLLTSSGDYFEADGISFVGTGFTGDNINSTGNHPRFIRCSSTGTAGRPLKATGSHVQIYGTCGTYTTTDATASGYDIEIGVSGTATLYHELHGIYTSQAAGGILLTDVGSHSIVGGQFGKLTIAAGTSPAGINGGKTIGARILGAVSVGLSNATFAANQFGGSTVTIESGVTGTMIDPSNTLSNTTTIVNSSGNYNQALLQNDYTGAAPITMRIKIGDSDSLAVLGADPATGDMYSDGSFKLPRAKSFVIMDDSGNNKLAMSLDASLNGSLALGDTAGATYGIVSGGSNGVYINTAGTSRVQFYAGGYRPAADNTYNSGTLTQRWNTVYTLNLHTSGVTVANLPAAGTIGAGARAFATDATATTFASVVSGGGANKVPVYSDGTDWRIG